MRIPAAFLEITGGTGKGISGRIATMSGSSVTVLATMTPCLDTTSTYRIMQPRALADCGVTSLAGTNVIIDVTKRWSLNQWVGYPGAAAAGWYAYLPGYNHLNTPLFQVTTIARGSIAHPDEPTQAGVNGTAVAPANPTNSYSFRMRTRTSA